MKASAILAGVKQTNSNVKTMLQEITDFDYEHSLRPQDSTIGSLYNTAKDFSSYLPLKGYFSG